MADILISAHGSDDGGNAAGKVHLILGSHLGDEASISLSEANYHFVGENEGDFAGWPVLTGDVDGDGLDDIFVGAFHNDDGGEDAGKVYTNFFSNKVVFTQHSKFFNLSIETINYPHLLCIKYYL